eukprot:g265.t1
MTEFCYACSSGGALYMLHTKAFIFNSTFRNNTAAGNGGALYAYKSAQVLYESSGVGINSETAALAHYDMMEDDDLFEAMINSPSFGTDSTDSHKAYRVITLASGDSDDSPLVPAQAIGRGSFGVVHCATLGAKRVALKLVHNSSPSEILVETEVLSELAHPGIVRLLALVQEPVSGDQIGLVMELVSETGDTLQRLIDSHNIYTLRAEADEGRSKDRVLCELLHICSQLGEALSYLCSKGVIHRDIKPNNCLLSQDWRCVKLSDFGLSKKYGDTPSVATQSRYGAVLLQRIALTTTDRLDFGWLYVAVVIT